MPFTEYGLDDRKPPWQEELARLSCVSETVIHGSKFAYNPGVSLVYLVCI